MTMNETNTEAKGEILVVDDTSASLQLLTELLTEQGYKVRPTKKPQLAVESALFRPPDLILLDIKMPKMNGFEVCRQLKADARTRDVPIIFVSALQELKDRLEGFQVGGVDYITKPIQREEVLARVHTHLQLAYTQRALCEARDFLEERVEERTAELLDAQEAQRKSTKQLHEILLQTINAIAATVEKRDPYTAGHQQRVCGLAVAIGEEMSLEAGRIEGLRLGALIHDIGKISVPVEILSRPGKLSKAEFNLIKRHSLSGYDIIKGVTFPWPVADMIMQHHERQDGGGYPHGLKGDEIILEARILAVADVLEAMASDRPYRPAVGLDKAIDELKQGRGQRYDPEVVDCCLRVMQKGYDLEPRLIS